MRTGRNGTFPAGLRPICRRGVKVYGLTGEVPPLIGTRLHIADVGSPAPQSRQPRSKCLSGLVY
jgi:hypothetical protein